MGYLETLSLTNSDIGMINRFDFIFNELLFEIMKDFSREKVALVSKRFNMIFASNYFHRILNTLAGVSDTDYIFTRRKKLEDLDKEFSIKEKGLSTPYEKAKDKVI